MPGSWATSLDLHLELSGSRVRSGLEAALREAIRGGRLRPGTRLPPSRALALDLHVARNTVAEAYGQLVAEGWLAARTGSGTWVATSPATPAPATAHPPAGAPQPAHVDLRAGVPDLSAFPRSDWLASARRALSGAPHDALGYAEPQGIPVLRDALAEYLARARGVAVSPERVIVCAGFSQGLALVCEVLRARGATRFAAESHGIPAHRRVIEGSGLHLRTIDVDAQGAVTGDLRHEGGVLLTPAHQFPLGVGLSPHRRRVTIDWATERSAIVVEDDYDGEFRYDRQAVGALQALAPEHVVYAGTASKTLAPGLRLGWLVVPADLVEPIVALKASATRMSSALDQLTLAELFASGAYDRHVRRMRLVYRRRRDHLVAALTTVTPRHRLGGIAAGLHAVLDLPPGVTEQQVVDRAARDGLAVEGLGSYRARGVPPRQPAALVVGYSRPSDHALTGAVARLRAVLVESSGATKESDRADPDRAAACRAGLPPQ